MGGVGEGGGFLIVAWFKICRGDLVSVLLGKLKINAFLLQTLLFGTE